MGKRVSIYTEMLVELRRRIEGERCFTLFDSQIAKQRLLWLAREATNRFAVLACTLEDGEIDMQFLGYDDAWDDLLNCKVDEDIRDIIDGLKFNMSKVRQFEFPQISDNCYKQLAETYVSKFNKQSVKDKIRGYSRFKEHYIDLTLEVLERKRDEYLKCILESDFMGTHYKDEVKDGMEYLRRFVCYGEGRYVLGDMVMLGKHIYKNRENLTDEDIEKFLQYMHVIEYIQDDMDRLRFGEDCDLDKIVEFNARAAKEYVTPLVGCALIPTDRVERMWRKLFLAHASLLCTYNHELKECFIETDSTDFRKAFLQSLVGEMRGIIYENDARKLADALMDNSKTPETTKKAIQKRLDKINVTPESQQLIRRIIREA